MSFEPPPISPLDRRLAWSRLAGALFDEPGPAVEIDGYRIIEVLGRGAMGTVYLAHDPTLEREVAIKRVASGDRAAVLREARALARVADPRVVAVHHVGEHEGSVYIVMERVVGVDLREWQGHPRTAAAILDLYLEVARGLDAAHRLGVVHRDFKPDNVRVDEQGRARILDFGLAGIDGEAEPAGGTLAYVAPEQAAGGAADPRMDQYAWAVAVHEALTGARSQPGVMEGPGELPARLGTILARAREVDPARRWPSMAAMIEAIEAGALASASERGRGLVLDKLEAAWLAGVLGEARRPDRVELRPTLALRPALARAPARGRDRGAEQPDSEHVELERADRVLGSAGAVVLLGGPGSGKTTALLELAALALARARQDPSAPLPVVLNLSSWSSWTGPSRSLERWLLDALWVEYGIPAKLARRWLDEDGLLILLDGLDEVIPERRRACLAAIETLRSERPLGLALTCRSGDYLELAAPAWADLAVELQPLTSEAVRVALERIGSSTLAEALGSSPRLAELATSPLIVDVLTRCVRAGADAPLELDDADALLEALLTTLVDRQLEALEPPQRAWLRERLGRLAAALERQGSSELWLERLQPSWLAKAWQRRIHALASLLIAAIPIAVIVAALLTPAAGARVASISAGLVAPLFVGVVGRGVGRIEAIERLSWSWSRLRRSWAAALGRALALAGGLSLIATLAWARGRSLEFVLAVALSNFGAYSLLLFVLLAVLAGLGGESVRAGGRLNEGMRASARNMFLVWAAVAGALAIPLLVVAASAGSWATPGFELEARTPWQGSPGRFFALVGGCVALTLGLVAGLLRGGFAVIQHAVLRVMLAGLGELPLRPAAVLELARERGLMLRIGGGHAFVHPTLQRHLAGDHDCNPEDQPRASRR